MDVALRADKSPENCVESLNKDNLEAPSEGHKEPQAGLPVPKQQQQQQQPPQKFKRKHRRGKPKAKNGNKPYKKTNWRFQVPRPNYSKCASAGGSGGCNRREKLQRSRSLVPYNTNKFLMEEHLVEVPYLLTPTGRTRDSSFSMDSEDNYFFSLPEDEEEFLTKEFANVYEKARVERLESLTKQELIQECLQIEDRYTKDQGNQRQQQLNIQRIAQEYMSKIRVLDEKLKELSRENHNLRCQLMRSAAFAAAAAASPPSATAPMGAACQPTPMDSSSEDSESDSTTSSSSTSSTSSSSSGERVHQVRRRRSCSSHSSLSDYNGYIENNYMPNNLAEEQEEGIAQNIAQQRLPPAGNMGNSNEDEFERRQLLDDHMDDEDDVDGDDDDEYKETSSKFNGCHKEQQQLLEQSASPNLLPTVGRTIETNADIQNISNGSNNKNMLERLENPLN